jgi:hypothetical protein
LPDAEQLIIAPQPLEPVTDEAEYRIPSSWFYAEDHEAGKQLVLDGKGNHGRIESSE